jgi:hypothetical protein
VERNSLRELRGSLNAVSLMTVALMTTAALTTIDWGYAMGVDVEPRWKMPSRRIQKIFNLFWT